MGSLALPTDPNISNAQIVLSRGIYHALPTYPHITHPSSIIVTGANGISGSAVVRALSSAPDRWSTIYALSRRAPPSRSTPANVKPIAVDFLESTAEEIADVFVREG